MGSIGPIDLSNHVQTVEYVWSGGESLGKGLGDGGIVSKLSLDSQKYPAPKSILDNLLPSLTLKIKEVLMIPHLRLSQNPHTL